MSESRIDRVKRAHDEFDDALALNCPGDKGLRLGALALHAHNKALAEIAELEAQLSEAKLDAQRHEDGYDGACVKLLKALREQRQAEAKLSALREPTEAMMEAGARLLPHSNVEGQDVDWAARIFKAMLTAAIGEKE